MEIYMRKPTFAEAYMYKNFLWLSVGVFAFIPFLNNFILQYLYLYTEGDIAYGSLGIFISTVKSVLSLASVYVGLGVFITAVINFGKNAVGIIRLAFLSHAVTFLSSVLTCILYSYVSYGYAITGDVILQITLLLIDGAVNLAVYVAVYLFLLYTVKRKETVLNTPSVKQRYTDLSHPLVLSAVISISIHAGAQLIVALVNMIVTFNDPSIGPPVSTDDVLYWVMQYLSVLAFAAVGLIVITLIFLLSEHYLKSGKRKKRA